MHRGKSDRSEVCFINYILNCYLQCRGDTLRPAGWCASGDSSRFICSRDGSKQQSDGARAAAGVGAPGRPVPALVLRVATGWQAERGRAGGDHQGWCWPFPVGDRSRGVNAAGVGQSSTRLSSEISV